MRGRWARRLTVVQADIRPRPTTAAALVEAALDAFGRMDLLVNNAGMAPRRRADLLETTEASYDEVMAVNLKGPVLSDAARGPDDDRLGAGGRGRHEPKIINIGSLSAYTGSLNRGEYCISKAGWP